MTRADAIALVRAIARTCRGPLSVAAAAQKDALLAAGEREQAAAVDRAGRRGCGADVNALIVAAPFDGVPRTAPCPACRTVIAFTPPVFAIDADDPERLEGDPLPGAPEAPDPAVVPAPIA